MHFSSLQSANLLGVKMLCANMEGTSLRGCNFEDPAGSRANMEGKRMHIYPIYSWHFRLVWVINELVCFC